MAAHRRVTVSDIGTGCRADADSNPAAIEPENIAHSSTSRRDSYDRRRKRLRARGDVSERAMRHHAPSRRAQVVDIDSTG
jgi:hypothetical protein